MKKVISLLLVCMMMLSMVTVVSAANEFTITVKNVDASDLSSNDIIKVPIEIEGLPFEQCTDPTIVVQFDGDLLTYKGFETQMQQCDITDGTTLSATVWNGSSSAKNPTYGSNIDGTNIREVNAFWGDTTGKLAYTAASVNNNKVLLNFLFNKVEGKTGKAQVDVVEILFLNKQNDEEYVSMDEEVGTINYVSGYVELSKPTYDITKEQDVEHGSFEIDKNKAKENETVTITANPDTGYVVDKFEVKKTDGGAEVTVTPNGNTATFTMPAANVTVKVTFKDKPAEAHNVTAPGTITGGSITVAPTSSIRGESITITVAPEAGYQLKGDLTATGVTTITKDNDTTYTFVMPDADTTVTGEFEKIKYNVLNNDADANVEITNIPAEAVAWDENVTVTVTPATGYNVTSVTAGGVAAVAGENNEYTFVMPKQDAEIVVVTEKKTYVLDVATNENINVTGLTSNGLSGTIEFATENVKAGENFEFTVTAPAGYYVGSVDAKNELGESVLVVPVLMGATETKTATMPMDGKIKFEATYLSNDSAIKALTVNGKAVAINDATKTGEVALDVYATTATVVVEVADGATAVIDGADMSGNVALTSDPQTITITVTSEAGENEIYAILVDNAVNPMMDTGISSITVNGKAATINGTDATVTLDVYAMTADINVVTVEEDATVTIGGVDGKTVVADIYSGAGDYIFNIVVTAKDGVTTETYTLTVVNPTQPTSRPTPSTTGGATGTTLADVKNNVSAKLDSAAEDLNKEDYSEEAWAEIEKLIEDAKADLENAKNVKAAEKIEKELLEAIEAVKTLDEEEPAEDVEIPVDEELEPAVIAAPEKSEEEIAAAEALYSDMEDHWALAYIHELSVANSVFKGNEDGTFAPDKGITRQEIAVALGRLLGLEEIAAEVTATDFTDDADIADWAKGYVAIMNELGLLKGNADGSFAANDVITREQLALILSRMVEAPEAVAGMAFEDVDGISDWAADGCAIAYTFGIVKGYPDNTFKGANTVTRAEAVVMIYNYLAAIAD